jgi:hypothetical protein
MKAEHQTSPETVKGFQRDGIPMAILKDEKWIAVAQQRRKYYL